MGSIVGSGVVQWIAGRLSRRWPHLFGILAVTIGLVLPFSAAQAQVPAGARSICGLELDASYSGYSTPGTGSATITQTLDTSWPGSCTASVTTPGSTDSDISAGLFPSANYPYVFSFLGPVYANLTVTSYNNVQYTVTATQGADQSTSQYTFKLVGSNTSGLATDYILMYAPNTSAGHETDTTPDSTHNPIVIQINNLPSGPSVTSLSPTSGPVGGGNNVTIAGSNFSGTTDVKFGTASASNLQITSTQIIATAPAGSVGTVDVTVINGTTSPTSANTKYTYVAAPTVTSISPTAGPTGGTTNVTITGTNLAGTTAVAFGGTTVTPTSVTTTQVTAASPSHAAGVVDVTVTTPGGTSATSTADQFTYVAAPTVTGISPISGPEAGGTTVTIAGSNLTNATAVSFGGTAATTYSVNSDSQITAKAPAGTGTVNVTVTTAGGTSAVSATFTYTPTPTITAISPTSGPLGGGNSVIITGTNFTGTFAASGAAGVKFGASNATSYTVNSNTQITAVVPAASAGTVDITVTNNGLTSPASAADQYTYVTAPTVASLSPTAGPTGGGTSVVITGTNFTGAAGAGAVKFGTTNATSYNVDSNSQITAVAPAGSGTVDVTVTTTGGTSAISGGDKFTYVVAPAITGISPTSGPAAGGTTVTITGSNFSGATAVTFGAAAATTFSVDSPTQITASSPVGSGQVDIHVTTIGGTSATTAADQFTYIAAPVVTSLSPVSGFAAGGTPVTITGSNFTNASAVTFGSTSVAFTVVSATSITTTSPAGTGTVDVRVTTPGGQSAIAAGDKFTYIAAPTVTAVSPATGPLAGGTSVTIAGTGFTGVTAVSFGATPATSYSVGSATSITATAPAGIGTVDIRVTADGGQSAQVAADHFTYVAAPAITSIAPTSGAVTGNTTVTITGTNFSGATAVAFGGTAATAFTMVSATSITATSPAGTGTVDITVTTPGGVSAATAADKFTYVPAPTVTGLAPNAGPAIGGTSVAITGTNFTGTTGGAGVKFGTVNATSYTVNSATSITAVAPAGSGVVDVTVTTNGQTSATSPADQFSYAAAPTITAISPTSGPASGGTSVTITGTGFSGTSGGAGVRFGAANATSYTVNSATSITAVAPAGTGTVDIVVTNAGQSSAPSAADRYAYNAVTTQTTVTSSQNPSSVGQSVTFTARVTSAGGTPTGNVTFNDGGTAIGSAALVAGSATFATSSLAAGAHSITAAYAGTASFAASTSPVLVQTVNIPLDSIRLRAMQLNVTKLIAQNSGQAMSGAIFDAISEGFSEDGIRVMPSFSGVRINFAAEPRDDDDPPPAKASSRFNLVDGRMSGNPRSRTPTDRIDDAFASIDRQTVRKAPPRWREQKDWLLWTEVRTTGVDRWNSSTTAGLNQVNASSLYGTQVNALVGLTYRVAPKLLVGVVGGWEVFNYTQQDINGRLKGDGWTVGAYLGWLITPMLRYDAAVTYSGIGYQGSAGTAQGNFNGERWMFATGLTGTHQAAGFLLEPSLRVYALWEHQNAYTDTLGTLQGTNEFASGRASAGLRAAYPLAFVDDIVLTPYLGIYGDYYFSQSNAEPLAGTVDLALASTPLLQGWSARATGGLGGKFTNGAAVLLGGELGGVGSNTRIWTFSAKARVPF